MPITTRELCVADEKNLLLNTFWWKNYRIRNNKYVISTKIYAILFWLWKINYSYNHDQKCSHFLINDHEINQIYLSSIWLNKLTRKKIFHFNLTLASISHFQFRYNWITKMYRETNFAQRSWQLFEEKLQMRHLDRTWQQLLVESRDCRATAS